VSRTLSLPHEHGGYLTLAAATLAGVAIAAARAPALAVGAVAAAAFFARAPLEQLARHRAARWDVVALPSLAAVALGGAVAVGGWRAAAALAMAGAIVVASLAARRARSQRTVWFETVGMAALGASAGLIAVAGGAAWRAGAVLAIVLGTHAGVAVPLVRSEVRPRERARAGAAVRLGMLALVGAAALLVGLGAMPSTVALLPRTLHAATRAMAPQAPANPTRVGLRETALLATAVLLAVWSAR
jgi:hypothetical protein